MSGNHGLNHILFNNIFQRLWVRVILQALESQTEKYLQTSGTIFLSQLPAPSRTGKQSNTKMLSF